MSQVVYSDHGIEEEPVCQICGQYLEWEECWYGCEDGFFDEYDDDPINFAPGEWLRKCEICEGNGGYLVCPNAPHDVKVKADIGL